MNEAGIPSGYQTLAASDTAFVPGGCVGLYVSVGGTLSVQTTAGTTVVMGTVVAGQELKGKFVRVMSTGTGATVLAVMA